MAIQIRSTQQAIAARVTANLQGNLERLGRLQEQLSSGKTISRPSDSPTGTVASLQTRGEIRTLEQYARNAGDGLGWLGTIDTTLTAGLNFVRRARDLVISGLSDATAGSAPAREALAVEVDNIREAMLQLANSRYLNRPVFGGTTTNGEAYTTAGVYQGTPAVPGGIVERRVAADTAIRVDLTGPEVFGADGDAAQLFTVLGNIATALRTQNAPALRTELGNIDTALGNIQTQLARVGARYNRVEQMRQKADDGLLTLRSQLSDVEDIDLPKTIMEVQLQQTAYQAALSTAARVIQPSLVDFLR